MLIRSVKNNTPILLQNYRHFSIQKNTKKQYHGAFLKDKSYILHSLQYNTSLYEAKIQSGTTESNGKDKPIGSVLHMSKRSLNTVSKIAKDPNIEAINEHNISKKTTPSYTSKNTINVQLHSKKPLQKQRSLQKYMSITQKDTNTLFKNINAIYLNTIGDINTSILKDIKYKYSKVASKSKRFSMRRSIDALLRCIAVISSPVYAFDSNAQRMDKNSVSRNTTNYINIKNIYTKKKLKEYINLYKLVLLLIIMYKLLVNEKEDQPYIVSIQKLLLPKVESLDVLQYPSSYDNNNDKRWKYNTINYEKENINEYIINNDEYMYNLSNNKLQNNLSNERKELYKKYLYLYANISQNNKEYNEQKEGKNTIDNDKSQNQYILEYILQQQYLQAKNNISLQETFLKSSQDITQLSSVITITNNNTNIRKACEISLQQYKNHRIITGLYFSSSIKNHGKTKLSPSPTTTNNNSNINELKNDNTVNMNQKDNQLHYIKDPQCKTWDAAPFNIKEKQKMLFLCIFPQMPIRLFLSIPCILTAWIFAKQSTVGQDKPNRENFYSMETPRIGIRKQLLYPILYLTRIFLLLFGFYNIDKIGSPSIDDLPIYIQNHITVTDAMIQYTTSSKIPSFVVREDLGTIPQQHTQLLSTGSILLDRKDLISRTEVQFEIIRRSMYNSGIQLAKKIHKKVEIYNAAIKGTRNSKDLQLNIVDDTNMEQVLKNVNERRSLIVDEFSPSFNPICVFPEGTTSCGKVILRFKLGAFRAGVPLQPAIIEYPHTNYNPAYVGQKNSTIKVLQRMASQFYNSSKIIYMKPYYPSEDEKQDPSLYTENVRKQMSEISSLPLSDLIAY